ATRGVLAKASQTREVHGRAKHSTSNDGTERSKDFDRGGRKERQCKMSSPVQVRLLPPKKKMYWRVIVRFSLTGDVRSEVRNLIIVRLKKYGIKNTQTGTWESAACEI